MRILTLTLVGAWIALCTPCAFANPQDDDQALPPVISPEEFESYEFEVTPQDSGIETVTEPIEVLGAATDSTPALPDQSLAPESGPPPEHLSAPPIDTDDFWDCDCNPFFSGAAKQQSNAYPTARLTGFFHLDATWFDRQADSPFFFGDDLIFPRFPRVLDTRGFRRARLAAVGSVAENVDYMLEMDFAFPGRPTFMDLYFDVRGFPLGTLRVGQWRMPFGLGELTSVKSLTFHERASMFFLGPFRKTGIGIYDSNGRSTYALSIFGGTIDNTPDQFATSIGDSNFGFAARLTSLLVDQGNQQVHLGAGFSHINLDRDLNNQFSVTILPEIIGAPVEFNTLPGTIRAFYSPSTQLDLFNSELAVINGPAHVESELRFARFNVPGADSIVTSFYAQMGYLLTGETRSYDRDNGVMGDVTPICPFGSKSGVGAWELAARYSYTDLASPNFFGGGRTNNFIVGLNWYLNRFTKFQFNYLRSLVDEPFLDSTVSAYSLRAQVAF